MFKTARFKVHNPSRHKQTMLWYALTHYHITLKRVLEATLGHPDFVNHIGKADTKGRLRPNFYAIRNFVRTLTPKGWGMAPIRDYLICNATAMLLSHLSKVYNGKHKSNPPTLPALEPMNEADYQQAYVAFTSAADLPMKASHEERIADAVAKGQIRVAERLERIYKSWAVSRSAGELLRQLEGAVPRPIEFTTTELGRGCLLARKRNEYFALIRLFSSDHRYSEQKVLADGFTDWKTGEDISGRTYPGLILPLEFSREYHEQEYLEHGKPQSAKLMAKRGEHGHFDFYLHVAFEFTPKPVTTESVLGIDRGAAKIGSGTVVDLNGLTVASKLESEGVSFSAEMARLRKLTAELQRRGHRRNRVFRLRGRKADAIVGEYANRVVDAALKYRSQIVIEKIDASSMARFLTQSQFAKLKQALTYKAERIGLPAPIEVPAAYTSQTCAKCGHRAAENRPKRDASGQKTQAIFHCVACGYEANADDNASEVIALRGLHQVQNGGKFQKFDIFQLWLKELGRDERRALSASVP